jgi:hypothetical protein
MYGPVCLKDNSDKGRCHSSILHPGFVQPMLLHVESERHYEVQTWKADMIHMGSDRLWLRRSRDKIVL